MDDPRKILIIQLKRAGDVILTTPAASVLKERFPRAQIHFLVERAFAPLLERHPAIDRLQIYEKDHVGATLMRVREERYDAIFDFQSSPRSALAVVFSGARVTAGFRVPFWGRVYRHTVRRPDGSVTVVRGKLSLLESLTAPVTSAPPERIFLTEDEKSWAKQVQPEARGRLCVGLVPTHRRSSRRWQAESYAALARLLDQAGYNVWLFWGPGERAYVDRIHESAPQSWVTPLTTWRQMAALMARCALVAANDNGPMHIAVAVGAPTVTLYGPTDPAAWNPGPPGHLALQAAGLSCLRCNLNECPFGHECMTGLKPESVLAACKTLLAETAHPVPT